jgi:hypothetical protein
MADYTKDIRDLRTELGKVMTEFQKEVDAGNKKLLSLSKSAEEFGKKMGSAVDPAAMLEKQLSRMGVQYDALKNQSAAYNKTIEQALSSKQAIRDQLLELAALEKKNTAAATTGGAALTAIEAKRLSHLQSQETNLIDSIKIYADIGREANKLKADTDSQLESLGKQKRTLEWIHSIYSTMMSLGEGYDKLLSEEAKAQGTTKDEINRQYEAIQKINTGVASNLASNQEILKAVTAIRKEYAMTDSQLASIGKESANISRLTGLSVDEAVKFQTTLAEVGGTSVMAQEAMTVIAAKAAEAAGVPMGMVMKDVANASNAVKVVFKGNTTELIKQAAEARKLGTSLEAAAKSADSLLNFESSIGAELKASALLGQGINFNESRRLFFQGNVIEGEKALQKEIARVGDLDKLNYNQRKALADATGKDFGELLKIQTQKKNLIEAERMFPEEAKKMKKAQEELNALQKKGPEARKAELELMLKQKTAEAELEKLNKSKQEALINIGKLLEPIYRLIMSIQTVFFKFISYITNLENPLAKWSMTAVVGIGLLVTAFYGLKFGLSKLVDFLGNVFAKAAQSAGQGVGSALSAVSTGLKDLGNAMNAISPGSIAKIAVLMLAMAAAAWGVSKALQNLGTVSVGQILAFTIGMSIMMLALGAFALMAEAIAPGLLILTVALLGMGLAAMEVGFALKMAAPALDSIGKTISALATVVGGVIVKAFDTMLAVFQALPEVIMSVATGLSIIADIGLVKLTKAAIGIGQISSAMVELGQSLTAFPTAQLESITAQIDMLSQSAEGLQVAVGSLKELGSMKLPALDFGGGAAGSSGVLAAGSNNKDDNNSDIKAGLQVLADKFDVLANMMASGGIAVNLDGVKVSYVLAKTTSQRGSFGQVTIG